MHAAPSEFKLVPLAALQLSPLNVATTDRGKVDDLVASIDAHGLQQNLVVTAGAPGKFNVVAGGRRLRALQSLATSGRWPEDRMVPVSVLDAGASASEISTTENVSRADMHPADEAAAFRALIDGEHLTVADVAARFGKTERYVEQRLKIAGVSPQILEYYRAGKLTLGQVVALAIVDDHGEQEKTWTAAKRQGEHSQTPEALRRALTRKELSCEHDPVARFLGAADYELGGGVARRDLFGSETCAWLPDAKLARQLAASKLERAAAALDAEGWSWRHARVEFPYSEQHKFTKFGADRYGYVDTSKTTWPAEAKKVAGIVATIGDRGELKVHRGLIRPADAKKAAEAVKAGKKAAAKSAPAKPKKPAGLSFAQTQRLQGDRTAVLRLQLSTQPRIALAALAADLVRDQSLGTQRMQRWESTDDQLVRISGDRVFNVPGNIREAVEAHPASKALAAAELEWAKRIKPGAGRMFAWLLEQPEQLTHELLAFLAARTIVAGETFDKGKDRGLAFAATAGVDMHDHWRPTLAWLQAQPKAVIVAAVAEAVGKPQAAAVEKLAKGAAATRAAELLANARWVPKPLRAPATKPATKAAKSTRKAAA